jgi:hypothetical protein
MVEHGDQILAYISEFLRAALFCLISLGANRTLTAKHMLHLERTTHTSSEDGGPHRKFANHTPFSIEENIKSLVSEYDIRINDSSNDLGPLITPYIH